MNGKNTNVLQHAAKASGDQDEVFEFQQILLPEVTVTISLKYESRVKTVCLANV